MKKNPPATPATTIAISAQIHHVLEFSEPVPGLAVEPAGAVPAVTGGAVVDVEPGTTTTTGRVVGVGAVVAGAVVGGTVVGGSVGGGLVVGGVVGAVVRGGTVGRAGRVEVVAGSVVGAIVVAVVVALATNVVLGRAMLAETVGRLPPDSPDPPEPPQFAGNVSPSSTRVVRRSALARIAAPR
jgi:hypothetical protein